MKPRIANLLWWSSEILPLLWVVLRRADPTYMGYQNSVDHHTTPESITSSL